MSDPTTEVPAAPAPEADAPEPVRPLSIGVHPMARNDAGWQEVFVLMSDGSHRPFIDALHDAFKGA